MEKSVVPFDQEHQLSADLDGYFKDSITTPAGICAKNLRLPGHPGRRLDATGALNRFLLDDLCTPELDLMAPRLWMMTTYSGSNIYALHFQKVKGREIVISEYPRFHLTWKHSQIFIKPLPKYLLSFAFWDTFLVSSSSPLSNDREKLLQAAKGLLRTYYHLVQYESDFIMAQEARLLSQDITWEEFSNFISKAQFIGDDEVSPRYCYGEIRLTRLNFYSIFFLHRSQYEWGRPQYSTYFGQFYGHILFIFAMLSLLLSAMQVELASESLVGDKWLSLWYICRYSSVICIVLLILIALSILGRLIAMIASEWLYAIRSTRKGKYVV